MSQDRSRIPVVALRGDLAVLKRQNGDPSCVCLLVFCRHAEDPTRGVLRLPGPLDHTPVGVAGVADGSEGIFRVRRVASGDEEFLNLRLATFFVGDNDVLKLGVVGVHVHHLVEVGEVGSPLFCPYSIHDSPPVSLPSNHRQ